MALAILLYNLCYLRENEHCMQGEAAGAALIRLILAADVEFGQPVSIMEVKPTKYAGAAKVLKGV